MSYVKKKRFFYEINSKRYKLTVSEAKNGINTGPIISYIKKQIIFIK